jgi:hypothetical protein|tara:strand:- start:19428 stop:20369 length:942 start_codon:yes stop_codon:yes gene_type:complete
MDARGDLLIVVGLFVGLGLVWFFIGGPDNMRGDKPFISPPKPIGSGELYGPGKFTIPKVIIGGTGTQTEATEDTDQEQEGLVEIGTGGISPFAGLVEFGSSRSGARKESPKDEYVIIEAPDDNTERVIIAGWRLASPITGKSIAIEDGTRLPRSGIVNSETPIFLNPGERAVITTGRSPIGISFLTNKCTGYFEQFQDFSPRLKRECPASEDELSFATDVLRFDNDCLDFIERIPRCTMITETLPPLFKAECQAFINENIHYTGCIENHRDDSDFFGEEWRIFLERNNELWREKREIVRLLDRDGKIVDTLSY